MRGRWPRTSIAMEGVVGDEGGAKREGGRRVVTLTLERKLAMAVPPRHPRRPHAERARRELGGACGRTCFVFVFSVAPGAVVEPAARGMPALFPLRTPPPAPPSTKVSTMGSSGSDAGGGGGLGGRCGTAPRWRRGSGGGRPDQEGRWISPVAPSLCPCPASTALQADERHCKLCVEDGQDVRSRQPDVLVTTYVLAWFVPTVPLSRHRPERRPGQRGPISCRGGCVI